MQEADGRVEPDTLRRAAAIMRQNGIEEREERVDGIKRGAARTAAKPDVWIDRADQMIEDGEIIQRRFAFGSAKRLDAFVQMGDASRDKYA